LGFVFEKKKDNVGAKINKKINGRMNNAIIEREKEERTNRGNMRFCIFKKSTSFLEG